MPFIENKHRRRRVRFWDHEKQFMTINIINTVFGYFGIEPHNYCTVPLLHWFRPYFSPIYFPRYQPWGKSTFMGAGPWTEGRTARKKKKNSRYHLPAAAGYPTLLLTWYNLPACIKLSRAPSPPHPALLFLDFYSFYPHAPTPTPSDLTTSRS